MEGSRESLSERLSGLLAALRRSASSQEGGSSAVPPAAKEESNSNVSESSTKTATPTKSKSGDGVETLPELLEFLRTTSNPKRLREVVGRFLENPLLSENDRNLVKRKVQEKIEEQKRKKEEAKKALNTDSPARSESSSRAQEYLEDSPRSTPKRHEHRSLEDVLPHSSSNPLINALLDRKPEDEAKPENEEQHNEWVTSDVPDFSSADDAAQNCQDSSGFPSSMFSVPPPTINPYAALPQHILSEITAGLAIPPPSSFQVPPPNMLASVPPHLAGYQNQGVIANGSGAALAASLMPLTKITVDREKDMIPRTPTPPPIPPLKVNLRLQPGAMVPALSATGRLIMPGARVVSKRRPLSPMQMSVGESAESGEIRSEKGDKTPVKRAPERSKEVNDARRCYIRQYALRNKVSYEEAERILVEEENEFESAKRAKRSRYGSEDREEERDFHKDPFTYTKGFVPLVKQKFAKNCEDSDDYADEDPPDDYEREDPWAREERMMLPRPGEMRYPDPFDDRDYPGPSIVKRAGPPPPRDLGRPPKRRGGSQGRGGSQSSSGQNREERRRRKRGGKKHKRERREDNANFEPLGTSFHG